MNEIEKFEQEQIKKLTEGKQIPDFGAGDTVRVNVKITETSTDAKGQQQVRHRIQAFEGICIGRGGKGLNQSFTVRKISYGEGVERVFPLFSPSIDSIELVRRGTVRRAKLYYLRGRSGKSARIAERRYDPAADKAKKDKADKKTTDSAAKPDEKVAATA